MHTTGTSLSLLLLLHLSTSTPIPILNSQQAQPCSSPSCYNHPSLSPITLSKPSIANPHFPSHQLDSPSHQPSTPSFSNPEPLPATQEITINNSPTTPSSLIPPAEALSAAQPLSTQFLQSLSRSRKDRDRDVYMTEEDLDSLPLPSKPTAALPELRRADRERYWAKEQGREAIEGRRKGGCMRGKGAERMRRREASDFLVVGVVVLFLVVVCWWEVWGSHNSNQAQNSLKHNNNTCCRRGEIFLEEDETVAFIVKKPRVLSYRYVEESEKVEEGERFRDEKGLGGERFRDEETDTCCGEEEV